MIPARWLNPQNTSKNFHLGADRHFLILKTVELRYRYAGTVMNYVSWAVCFKLSYSIHHVNRPTAKICNIRCHSQRPRQSVHGRNMEQWKAQRCTLIGWCILWQFVHIVVMCPNTRRSQILAVGRFTWRMLYMYMNYPNMRNKGGLVKDGLAKEYFWFMYLNLHLHSIQFEEVLSAQIFIMVSHPSLVSLMSEVRRVSAACHLTALNETLIRSVPRVQVLGLPCSPGGHPCSNV